MADYFSAMHYAVLLSKPELLNQLIATGHEPFRLQQHSPLWLALELGNIEISCLLIELGARADLDYAWWRKIIGQAQLLCDYQSAAEPDDQKRCLQLMEIALKSAAHLEIRWSKLDRNTLNEWAQDNFEYCDLRCPLLEKFNLFDDFDDFE
jgi:hypothetical protein